MLPTTIDSLEATQLRIIRPPGPLLPAVILVALTDPLSTYLGVRASPIPGDYDLVLVSV
jgi:hypothetical protein